MSEMGVGLERFFLKGGGGWGGDCDLHSFLQVDRWV